jgi:hypothetical protein|tara:strand:+ start:671 stop:913 length:243 start_codon:yes stop_codon:yes gene_type:complete
MEIKRLLDDREVFAGSQLFYAQGRSYTFVEHLDGELVVARVALSPLLAHGTLPANSTQQPIIDGLRERAIIQWLNYRRQL